MNDENEAKPKNKTTKKAKKQRQKGTHVFFALYFLQLLSAGKKTINNKRNRKKKLQSNA